MKKDFFQYFAVLRIYLDHLIDQGDTHMLHTVLNELYERLKLDYSNR
ncbi:hypothetical protein [Bacteroides helcogenes]|uniref:Uncharacterized protein n=1 Tax=Bacteroides helcogenes (strain ATCC 35417 / DSM 20613 / JCM 6297 / CCUG 15421 / P 36-108) TaxID=693979 RepID=E6SVW4_BACT6|nr:hypothetical protein [Bacteroides helcogenes]ADV44553.1 hypothetical protein Bache_2597 [Bacteroides helcogenes P 36-108]MDY5238968.1 hypothetical protein [Bacteroides helcogenes]